MRRYTSVALRVLTALGYAYLAYREWREVQQEARFEARVEELRREYAAAPTWPSTRDEG